MWGRLREYLLRNLGLKIASLLLASILYAHVVTDQERESEIGVPVHLSGLPENLAVVGRPPARVGVRVRGKWKDLIRLGLTSPYLSIDLAEASPGRFHTSISVGDVQERAIPAELTKVVNVTNVLEPRAIDLIIEPKRAKMVRLRARVVGTPAPGFTVMGVPGVEPDSARAEGPASALAALDTLYTLPVDITGERERIHRQVQIDLGPSLLAVVPRRCVVTIPIARAVADSARRRP